MHLSQPIRLTNVITYSAFILTGRSFSVLLIWILGSFSRGSYIWQVAQLVAEHELQEELPPMGVDGPSLFLEKEAKEENIRLAPL
jgi:hypothetical protein